MLSRSFYILIITVLCVVASCTSSRHSASKRNVIDTLKTQIVKSAHQEVRAVDQSIKDSVTVLSPDDIQPKDPNSMVQEGKGTLVDQVTKDTKGMPEINIDSTLFKQAATYGAEQARKHLSEEYGISEIAIDSAALSAARQKAKEEAENYVLEHSGTTITLDSLSKKQILTQSEQLLEEQIEQTDYFKNLENTLSEQQGILDTQKSLIDVEKARMEEYLSQQAIKEKMTSAAREFIQQHANEIQSLQTEMNDLKQVYSRVPDSEDLTTAVKQTSLEEESFGKRLVFGGNFNIGRTDPLSLDLSPLIGYRLNTLFNIGVSGSYRAQIEKDNFSVQMGEKTTYGYSVFASHKVYRHFFGYLEVENKAITSNTENGTVTTWDQGVLLGVGKEIGIGNTIKVQVMVLYNFLYDNNNSLYNSPVIFKTGIQF